jgi:hypothetical protein
MMIRKKVLDELNGYDETLAYEDFDFWVRSSRKYKYNYMDAKLTIVRKTASSMSTGWYRVGDKQLHSTYLVCRKAQGLVRSQEEKVALIKRVRYELGQSAFSENFIEGKSFFTLLKELTVITFSDRIFNFIITIKLPLTIFRKLYYRIKFKES